MLMLIGTVETMILLIDKDLNTSHVNVNRDHLQ